MGGWCWESRCEGSKRLEWRMDDIEFGRREAGGYLLEVAMS